MSNLPGDIQIDLAIKKLGFGSHCHDKLLQAKINRFLADKAQAQPKRKRV